MVEQVSKTRQNILELEKNRIYELLNNQTLKGFRIGSTWKISRMALEEYIMNASKL